MNRGASDPKSECDNFDIPFHQARREDTRQSSRLRRRDLPRAFRLRESKSEFR